jgi:hypothetical protein
MYSEIRTNYVHGALVEGRATKDCDGFMVAVTVDGWPIPKDPEHPEAVDELGHTILQVIATPHGDIVYAWHDNGARFDEDVLEAIKDCKQSIRDVAEQAKDQCPEFYREVIKNL